MAYDAHGGMFAARLWWLLRWVGHEAVAVLDGGLAGLAGAGPAAVDRGAGRTRARHASPRARRWCRRSTSTTCWTTWTAAARTVVDARAPDRFRGENETIDPVGGHIPGAKNRFFKDNLQPTAASRRRNSCGRNWALIVGDPRKAIMQCGSGVTACHNLLALEVAGLPGAALYPGSWSEWSADPARPRGDAVSGPHRRAGCRPGRSMLRSRGPCAREGRHCPM